MHPAPSIIIFTTLSGAGFGLIVWLGVGFGPRDVAFGLLACGLALLLTAIGLSASLWHLGNPQRAWRALSQWRSSWLSREGVLAVAALATFVVYALFWLVAGERVLPLGLLSAVLASSVVYATAMIYASIKAVPRWSKPSTPLLFLSYAGAGGALAFAAAVSLVGDDLRSPAIASGLSVLAAALAAYRWRRQSLRTGLSADGSTPETAIGLPTLGHARLLEGPHSSPNYLMKEMIFLIGRKHAEWLHKIALNGAFIFPLICLALVIVAPVMMPIMILAFIIHLVGVAASRWLFFAEAQHVVSLYYGHR